MLGSQRGLPGEPASGDGFDVSTLRAAEPSDVDAGQPHPVIPAAPARAARQTAGTGARWRLRAGHGCQGLSDNTFASCLPRSAAPFFVAGYSVHMTEKAVGVAALRPFGGESFLHPAQPDRSDAACMPIARLLVRSSQAVPTRRMAAPELAAHRIGF